MSAPLVERLFGIHFKPEPARTVRELLAKVRAAAGQSGDIVVARRDDTVADAARLFETHDVHHLPVLDGARVVGIVSATDLLRCFVREDAASAGQSPLARVMTADPEVILDTAPIQELARRLAHAPFRCLPVVSEGAEFIDIATTRDLVRFLELCME